MFRSKNKQKNSSTVELHDLHNEDSISIGRTPDSEKNVRFGDVGEDGGRSSSKSTKRLSRGQSIQRGVSTLTRKTMGFISINEELTPEERKLKQEKWMLLRQRHLDKLGRKPNLFSSSSSKNLDVTDGHPQNQETLQDLGDIVKAAQWRGGVQTLQRRKRENAVGLLWKAGMRSISSRPRPDLSTIESFGGRSFAIADLADDQGSVFLSDSNLDTLDGGSLPQSLAVTPVPTPSFNLAHDDLKTFFEFNDSLSIRNEPLTPSLDLPDGRSPSSYTTPTFEYHHSHLEPPPPHTTPTSELHATPVTQHPPHMVKRWESELGPEPSIGPAAPGDYTRRFNKQQNVLDGRRLPGDTKNDKKYKYNREFGKGIMGNFLNRTLNRKKITSRIEEQFEEVSNHRPYFTYWLSFVQVVIMIVMLCLYPLANIGVKPKTVTKDITISRGGVLMRETVETQMMSSFWIGPSIATLIKLGAKYTPCMRKDKKLFATLKNEKQDENSTGCCIENRLTGCIQRQYMECSSSSTTFYEKSVCGQDPKFCIDSSIPSQRWDRDTITNWPVCRKFLADGKLDKTKFPWMKCEVTGRPCCVRNQGQCIITTRENCDFHDGTYHPDATLCSQVDCLQSTCGMLGFSNPDEPDQFYRLVLSLFLNAGIIHVALVLVFNFTILRDIEIMAGWLRTALIFLLSGIGGNLWSAILLPYEPEVGELGASFGILSCLFVEVIQAGSLLKHPWIALGKLSAIMIILLFVGLLPYIDNFAHIFGFIYGFFLSLIFLPYVVVDEWDERRKRIQTFISLLIVIAISVVGFSMFYSNVEIKSDIIKHLNCVPIVEKDFCSNFHLGSKLESRHIEY